MPKTREQQGRRRREILSILDSGIRIESLDDLLHELAARGFQVGRSSVSRDLQELEIVRTDGRYQAPVVVRDDAALEKAAYFIRKVVPSGPYLTVIQCAPGAGRLVARVLKSLGWMEISGMVADDHTVVVSTAKNYDQKLFLDKLSTIPGRTDTVEPQALGKEVG